MSNEYSFFRLSVLLSFRAYLSVHTSARLFVCPRLPVLLYVLIFFYQLLPWFWKTLMSIIFHILYFSTRSSAPLSRWVSNWSSRRDKFNGTICNQIYWKIRILNFQLKVVNCVHKSQFLHNFPSYLSAKKIVESFWSFCTYSWLKWIKVWKSLRPNTHVNISYN